MDIAALSMSLSQSKVQQQAGLSVMKLAMDTARIQGAQMAELAAQTAKTMELSVQPHLGAGLDIRA